jgi:ATP-dependent DNA ligase
VSHSLDLHRIRISPLLDKQNLAGFVCDVRDIDQWARDKAFKHHAQNQTKNVVESELVLLGTDYDNEGKPIAYLGRQAAGELKFAGTAFLTLSGAARHELQARIEKLVTEKPPVPQRVWRQPQWLKPELRVRVRHLQGGDTLRHASVLGLTGSVPKMRPPNGSPAA